MSTPPGRTRSRSERRRPPPARVRLCGLTRAVVTEPSPRPPRPLPRRARTSISAWTVPVDGPLEGSGLGRRPVSLGSLPFPSAHGAGRDLAAFRCAGRRSACFPHSPLPRARRPVGQAVRPARSGPPAGWLPRSSRRSVLAHAVWGPSGQTRGASTPEMGRLWVHHAALVLDLGQIEDQRPRRAARMVQGHASRTPTDERSVRLLHQGACQSCLNHVGLRASPDQIERPERFWCERRGREGSRESRQNPAAGGRMPRWSDHGLHVPGARPASEPVRNLVRGAGSTLRDVEGDQRRGRRRGLSRNREGLDVGHHRSRPSALDALTPSGSAPCARDGQWDSAGRGSEGL